MASIVFTLVAAICVCVTLTEAYVAKRFADGCPSRNSLNCQECAAVEVSNPTFIPVGGIECPGCPLCTTGQLTLTEQGQCPGIACPMTELPEGCAVNNVNLYIVLIKLGDQKCRACDAIQCDTLDDWVIL